MSELIKKLVMEKMRKNDLSMRSAAANIGVSHTTLIRILHDEPYDVPTAEKVANWLNVPVSTLLDINQPGEDGLARQIALVLRQEPALAKVFGEAMARVLEGSMTLETMRSLVSYAAFQINNREELAGNGGFETET